MKQVVLPYYFECFIISTFRTVTNPSQNAASRHTKTGAKCPLNDANRYFERAIIYKLTIFSPAFCNGPS